LAGWPWPLDGVQAWFESLWDHVVDAATSAVSVVSGWINNAVDLLHGIFSGIADWLMRETRGMGNWLRDVVNFAADYIISRVSDISVWLQTGISNLGVSISTGLSDLKARISSIVADVGAAVKQGLSDGLAFIDQKLSALGSFLQVKISESAVGFSETVTAGIGTLSDQVSATGFWIVDGVHTAFDGAATAIGDTLGSIFKSPLQSLSDFLVIFQMAPKVADPMGIINNITALTSQVEPLYTRMFRGHSPLTPDEAAKMASEWEPAANLVFNLAQAGLAIIEAATLGLVDVNLAGFMNSPILKTYFGTAERMAQTRDEATVLIPLRYYYLRETLPMIPPTPDLIQMVVREAFDPKQVVKAPAVFAEYMEFTGFSREWSDRYWTAHFFRAPLGVMEENFRRGFLEEAELRAWFIIADIHPGDHDYIMNQIYGAPTRLDLRQGYAARVYSKEDLVHYLRMRRLSPRDAELAAEAIILYLLRDEITKLASGSEDDYVDDLISLAEHAANLEALQFSPEEIEYRVAIAEHRRDTLLRRQALSTARSQFLKDRITEEQYREDLLKWGVSADRAEFIIKDAAALKTQQTRETTAEKKKKLTKATVDKALELGLIGDQEYVRRLMDADYDEEDSRLMLSIESTPRPVSLEELERRRRSIISRRNRALRRFEAQLLRISQEIENTEAQRDNLEKVKAESLDVYTEEIEYITSILPMLPEDQAETRRRRRATLTARMEAAEARFNAQLEALIRQISDLQETKALVEEQQAEEIEEYDNELMILGVPAA